MINRVPIEAMYPIISEMIESNGTVKMLVSGYSMQPMIYHARDTVTLCKARLPLKKYEIPLFRQEDGKFVMHRVVRINKDGTYRCRGDNSRNIEDNIRDDQVIAVVKSFNRKGKEIVIGKSAGYWLYTRVWPFLYPFKKYYKYIRKLNIFRK